MSVCQKIQGLVRSKLGVRQPSKIWMKEGENCLSWYRQGFEEGMKNPLLWIDDDGNLRCREFTQDELEAGRYARRIVERAFPGFYDEED